MCCVMISPLGLAETDCWSFYQLANLKNNLFTIRGFSQHSCICDTGKDSLCIFMWIQVLRVLQILLICSRVLHLVQVQVWRSPTCIRQASGFDEVLFQVSYILRTLLTFLVMWLLLNRSDWWRMIWCTVHLGKFMRLIALDMVEKQTFQLLILRSGWIKPSLDNLAMKQ